VSWLAKTAPEIPAPIIAIFWVIKLKDRSNIRINQGELADVRNLDKKGIIVF